MLSIRLCVPWVREKVLCGFAHTLVMPDLAAYHKEEDAATEKILLLSVDKQQGAIIAM